MQKQIKQNRIEERLISMFKQGAISYQTDLLKFDFSLSIEEYFQLILPSLLKCPDNRSDREKDFIYGFFSYFKDFIRVMINLNGNHYQEILKIMIGYMSCNKYLKNTIITQQGDKANKVYLMLSGTADVVLPKRYKCNLIINDYYRYLAKLIVFKEYELLSRVLFENSQIFPLEILDCGSFGRINGYRMNNNAPVENVTTVSILKKYLTDGDKKLILRLSKNKLIGELSTNDYIERIGIDQCITKKSDTNHHKLNTSYYNDSFTTELNDAKYSFYLYNYIKQGSISAGQSFNDIGLVTTKATRPSTIISSSICYFSIIIKETYRFSVKKASNRSNKRLLIFILSSRIFAGNTVGLMSMNYKKYFNVISINKGDYVFFQNEPNTNVIILKEGCYEISIVSALSCIRTIVNCLYSIITKSKRSNSNNTSIEDTKRLFQEIRRLHEEEKLIKETQSESQMFNTFYFEKRRFKLFTISSPDYFGFEKLELNPNENYFSLQCTSIKGEYLQIAKARYYNITHNDQETKTYETLFCFQKNEKMIRRLMTIRGSLLQIFLKKNNSVFQSPISKQAKDSINSPISYNKPLSIFINKDINVNKTPLMNSKTKSMLSLDRPSIIAKKLKANSEFRKKNGSLTKTTKHKSEHKKASQSNNDNPHCYLDNSLNYSHMIDSSMHIQSIDPFNSNQIKAINSYFKNRKENKHLKHSDYSFSISNDYESKSNLILCSMKSRYASSTPSQYESSINKSVSIEHYKEMKENEYRMKRNSYLIKATRDFFLKRKQSIRLCKRNCKSQGIILK